MLNKCVMAIDTGSTHFPFQECLVTKKLDTSLLSLSVIFASEELIVGPTVEQLSHR